MNMINVLSSSSKFPLCEIKSEPVPKLITTESFTSLIFAITIANHFQSMVLIFAITELSLFFQVPEKFKSTSRCFTK